MVALGGIEILRVEELCVPFFPPGQYLVGLPEGAVERHRAQMQPNFIDPSTGFAIVGFHSWVVKVGNKTILVDGCLGNDKNRPGLPPAHRISTHYLENLSKLGLSVADIDFVFCTHLHVDHVGWNTRLDNGRWIPTFPKARYLFGRLEYEFWQSSLTSGSPQAFQECVIEDSVIPVVEAGQMDLVDDGFQVARNVHIESAYGHSPGHSIMRAKTRGDEAVFCGDVVHHPLQILYPEVNSFACLDAEQSRQTRRRILAECAEHGQHLFPAHFGAPHFGSVSRQGERFDFHPGARTP